VELGNNDVSQKILAAMEVKKKGKIDLVVNVKGKHVKYIQL